MSLLVVKTAAEASVREVKSDPFDDETWLSTKKVVEDVKKRGREAVCEYALKYGEIDASASGKLVLSREELREAYESLDAKTRGVLDRTAARIKAFAEAQKGSLSTLSVSVCGGHVGHSLLPIASAGCYAPGGRYPLPSSVLMTALTAQVAGVSRIIVASPRPNNIVRAAAFISGAHALLPLGGAHAIAALAYGIPGVVEPVDVIVGPGNRYVTAAKSIVSSFVKIDALAGPSECLVVADQSADSSTIAADLLAQAEHDDDARAILVTTSKDLLQRVEKDLALQLETLPSAPTARAALKNSFAVVVESLKDTIPVVDAIAPEHLELHFQGAAEYRDLYANAGAVFVGHHSAEVLGDYGFGPNHVLPTLASARFSSGLSVFTFLRTRTWIELSQISQAQLAVQDAVDMARLEGLEAHARSAEKRLVAPAASTPAKAEPIQETYHLPHTIPAEPEKVLAFAVPKGNMEGEIHQLLADAGLKLTITSRGYRPAISHPGIDVKLLKPRNVVQMVELGSRDVGFTGHDLIHELGIKGVECVLDTGMSPVRIVVAAPSDFIINGELKKLDRPYRIATEYETLTSAWMKERGIDFQIVRSRGATEVFPPEDADLIVDNTATGSTLRANNLHIVDTILTSTTGLYANSQALKDPKKRAIIDHMVTMMKAVLLARSHMIVEFHVPGERLQALLTVLPAMKQPTVTQLHNEAGHTIFSVKTAAQKNLGDLVRLIKENGGTDIVVTKPTYSSGFDFKKAVRTDLLEGYVGVKPLEVIAEEVGVEVAEIVKLDANENLYGAPPEVFAAVQSARFHEYPDPGQTYLRRDIAAYMGVKDSNICAGAGSDDLIDIIIRFARPGPVVISTPTFGMYTYLSKISSHPVIDVPLGPAPTFEVQIQKIIETIRENNAAIVFVVSPNNPTGTVCPTEYIELLCKEQVFVVVDEAYAEFNPEVQLTYLLQANPNLILLRTFSKWAALAGLRCGFAVASEEIINLMLSTKQPYNVNVAADYAARAALAKRDVIAFDLKAIMKEKLIMMDEIAKFSWLKPLPSKSNFFLVKVGGEDDEASVQSDGGSTSAGVKRNAHELWFNLRRLGILIRYFGKPPLAGYVRISAGRPQETVQLVEALKILDTSYVYQNLESFKGKSSYKAILFDMDGVLADESRSYRQSIVDTCAYYDAKLTLEDVTEYKASGGSNNDWQATYDLVLKYSTLEKKPTLEEVTVQFEKVYQGSEEAPGLWATETLIPRFSLLKFLASKLPLAIVTGRPRGDAERFLKHHAIADFFLAAVCAEDAPHKPDPAPVQLALALLQTQLGADYDLSRVLMIGDTPNDMLAATRAGIEGMGIIAPSERANVHMPAALKQAGATCLLSSLQELRLMFSGSS